MDLDLGSRLLARGLSRNSFPAPLRITCGHFTNLIYCLLVSPYTPVTTVELDCTVD